MYRRSSRHPAVAIIGYGSQGRALALNLRDSGYNVVVGLRPRSRSRKQAAKDGIKRVASVADAVKQAEVICFAFPDHRHGEVYQKQIRKHLQPGSTLCFLHGLSVHFGLVEPPSFCDVILIAPHAPGAAVRRKYLSDRSLSAFYAVHQDYSGRAARTALEFAAAIGFRKNRLVATSFEHEAVGDLFGEQAVLCGGLSALIKNGFEVLIEKGLPPENAYLEVAYQLDLIISLIKQHGIEGMLRRISVAARFGSLVTGPKIIDRLVKKHMRQAAADIVSGKFTRSLGKLRPADIAKLNRSLKQLTHPLLEKAAAKFAG
jgi:ketol-acid reductoisomerase